MGTGAAVEEAAGEGLLKAGFEAGGDVEIAEVGATEGAGGGFDAGELDLLDAAARGGIVADDFAAVAEGDPQTVFAVDGHAIGDAGFIAGVPDDALVFDLAGGGVEVEGADGFAGGVDVVKGTASEDLAKMAEPYY